MRSFMSSTRFRNGLKWGIKDVISRKIWKTSCDMIARREQINEESGVKYGLLDRKIGTSVTHAYAAAESPNHQINAVNTV